MTATMRITRYEVSILAEEDINHSSYAISVEYRGRERWAVTRHRFCLGVDGEWDYESLPSERTDEWLARYRFDLETALRLAEQAAPDITVNGRSAKDLA